MGKVRYITSRGELTRKDNSICFRKDDKNVYIPVEDTREIYCLNEISINTKLLDFLASHNIIVHFFNYYGSYSGTFYPREHYISGKITVKQAELYSNDRFRIAKPIVTGINQNIIETLNHYYKHGNNDIKNTLDILINDIPSKIENSDSINSLLLIEGDIWYNFYNSLKYVLREEFEFDKRVRRPPDNPINAMISFGNSLVYSKTITALYHTHLNQSISFLHEPSTSRFSLSLDISEVFKPLLTYKTILNLTNNKMININKHFIKDTNYCMLNDAGREIFLKEFESRLQGTFMHTSLKRLVSYETAIKLDGYKIIKTLLEDKPFRPFSMKEKF